MQTTFNKMARLSILSFFFALSVAFCSKSYADDVIGSSGSQILSVEYSVTSGNQYSALGIINLRTLTKDVASFSHTGSLTSDEKNKLKDLVRNDGFYQIRIPFEFSDNERTYISSSVRACQLLHSRLQVILTLSLDAVGYPIAVHVSTPLYGCSITVPDHIDDLPDVIVASVVVQKPSFASSPETAEYLRKLERQREEMARAEQGDNRSFLSKYWTYLIPVVVLFVLFSNMQDPNAAGGGSGGR